MRLVINKTFKEILTFHLRLLLSGQTKIPGHPSLQVYIESPRIEFSNRLILRHSTKLVPLPMEASTPRHLPQLVAMSPDVTTNFLPSIGRRGSEILPTKWSHQPRSTRRSSTTSHSGIRCFAWHEDLSADSRSISSPQREEGQSRTIFAVLRRRPICGP